MAHLAGLRGGKTGDDGRGIGRYSLIINSIQFSAAVLFQRCSELVSSLSLLYSTQAKPKVAAAEITKAAQPGGPMLNRREAHIESDNSCSLFRAWLKLQSLAELITVTARTAKMLVHG